MSNELAMPAEAVGSGEQPPTEGSRIRLIGYVPVDSGQVMIIDPIYADYWNEHDYLVASQVSAPSACGGQYLKIQKTPGDYSFAGGGYRQEAARLGFDGMGFFAVLSATYLGDGLFPVYATEEDGMVTKLEIRFDEDEWLAPTGRIPDKVTSDSPENIRAAEAWFSETEKSIIANRAGPAGSLRRSEPLRLEAPVSTHSSEDTIDMISITTTFTAWMDIPAEMQQDVQEHTAQRRPILSTTTN